MIKFTIAIAVLSAFMAHEAKADCVSEMIYHEARSESFAGQIAVANVAYNRAENSGKSVCREIHKPKQFSYLNSGHLPPIKEQDAYRTAKYAAEFAKWIDVTSGATHYNTRKLGYRKGARNKREIGNHVFYKLEG